MEKVIKNCELLTGQIISMNDLPAFKNFGKLYDVIVGFIIDCTPVNEKTEILTTKLGALKIKSSPNFNKIKFMSCMQSMDSIQQLIISEQVIID